MRAIVRPLLLVGVIVAAASSAPAQVLLENFNDNMINPALWSITEIGTGPRNHGHG